MLANRSSPQLEDAMPLPEFITFHRDCPQCGLMHGLVTKVHGRTGRVSRATCPVCKFTLPAETLRKVRRREVWVFPDER